jgi:4'-phosphopantetheinyl transferase EntD
MLQRNSTTDAISAILPREVAHFETTCEDLSGELFPEEIPAIANAVTKRVREFTTGRNCARKALCRLGMAPSPIGVGPRNQPLWPPGIVGSITHCQGYVAAAVGRCGAIAGLGIDAEPHEDLPDDIVSLIGTEMECSWLSTAPHGIHWDRLLFSAKESVFKAQFPLTGVWLEFGEIEISFDVVRQVFLASVNSLDNGSLNVAGRFLASSNLLRTTAVIYQVF